MGALDSLLVIEIGALVLGPQATATLRDWGADVVKVEHPAGGDLSRRFRLGPDDPRSAFFTACNRGKRSLALDLAVPAGRDLLLALVARADVLVANVSPGALDRLGLGWDVLSATNPRLVVGLGSAYGPEGPDAGMEGADLGAQAAGGLLSTISDGPHAIGVTIADHVAAQNLLAGVLAALLARTRTGRGQLVRTSLLGGQVWAQASELTQLLLTGAPAGPADRDHPMVPTLYGVFPTADGALALVGVTGALRGPFWTALGRPDLADVPRGPLVGEAKREVFAAVDAALATRTTAEWCGILRGIGVRHAPVRDHVALLADPTLRANDWLTPVDGADGPQDAVRPPVTFSDTPGTAAADAPALGAHTAEILAELGLGPAEVADLVRAGAVPPGH